MSAGTSLAANFAVVIEATDSTPEFVLENFSERQAAVIRAVFDLSTRDAAFADALQAFRDRNNTIEFDGGDYGNDTGTVVEGLTTYLTRLPAGATGVIGIDVNESDGTVAITVIHEMLHLSGFGIGDGPGEVSSVDIYLEDPIAIGKLERIVETEAQRSSDAIFSVTGSFDGSGKFQGDQGL